MLRVLTSLVNYQIAASDGDIGKVCDFYFDDEHWTIRYLVADTGGFWQGPHCVLISPIAFGRVDWATRQFHLTLERDKVKNSPPVDLNRPVSLQYEQDYHRYYGWAHYWGYSGAWGLETYPGALAELVEPSEPETPPKVPGEPHLRSARTVKGYRFNGGHELLGHVTDFIVDDETWTIRYLVVDTHRWWSGKKILVAPKWAQKISWAEETVYTDIPRELLKNSPEWDAGRPVNREYEGQLYDYYGRPAYWHGTEPSGDKADPSSAAPPGPLP
jgi:hypothetical protein